ncbi:MAG TPA: LytTR family DNA-binding domain-containing protein [Mucilaginibacter sp.]|nr:LytTR family DNA-binding domain-containing protein [Mucilaginibacter sp.]
MILSAIAIDDEPDGIELICMMAGKLPFVDLKATFTNAFTAMTYLQHNPVDLLFLDINMPDITGIELVTSLAKAPMVIFTTAYAEHAVEGFELNAIDYLLKPFALDRFVKACNKAMDYKLLHLSAAEQFLFVKTGYADEKINLADICYLEAEGNYITYVLRDRRLLSRQSLADALTLLPAGDFVRVHRSYIVAVSAISKITRSEITVGETTIHVGATYEAAVVQLRAGLRL